MIKASLLARKITPPVLFDLLRVFKPENKKNKANPDEMVRIASMPRYMEGITSLPGLGNNFKFSDSASFLSTYKSIFADEIYRFQSDSKSPFIIDAGANIGLSVLYLKKLFLVQRSGV